MKILPGQRFYNEDSPPDNKNVTGDKSATPNKNTTPNKNVTPTGSDACQPLRPKGKLARPKPCYMWTTADVLKWFKRHCSEYFQLYSNLLIMHDITGRALVCITEGTLLRMGITQPDHLEAIWREILKLRLKADIQEMKEIEMSAIS